jgi:hypothetical protein
VVLRAELAIDVTEPARLGEPAHVGVTVVAPDPAILGERPVVVFARPGAGFTAGYFTTVLPGQGIDQATWHADRGWVFVAVDHLGLGRSSVHDPKRLTFGPVCASADAADREVVARLAAGTLVPGLPPISAPVLVGLGQSMGGSLTIVQQAQHRTFDGIAVLGFSARHTVLKVPPGESLLRLPWLLREPPFPGERHVLNGPELEAARAAGGGGNPVRNMEWLFYGDELDPSTFEEPERWTTPTYLAAVIGSITAPGSIAQEAGVVQVPVLVAAGARDVVPDLRAEVFAYQSTLDVDLYECPDMAHMHNFAPTAELLWERIHHWGGWVHARTTSTVP